jgi:hypothetical protein|tara:strand:+ start:1200 stop:1409 length:210 start_codon:yes stop_codon:yes gene_type:complete
MSQNSETLTPFQENELQWLKQQVDRLQDDKYKTNEERDIQKINLERNLWIAREELNVFVKNLREAGKKI